MDIYSVEKNRDKPFQHRGRYGVELRASRTDLLGGVDLYYSEDLTQDQILAGYAECIGWWCCNVWPHLNGWPGFDCLVIRPKPIVSDNYRY